MGKQQFNVGKPVKSQDPRSETGSSRIYGKRGVTDCESETRAHTQVNNYHHLMWSCLIISVEQEAQAVGVRCGGGGGQVWCKGIFVSVRGHKCASAEHSGKQQGLEAVTSPLQLSTQLSGWWHEAVCTFLQHLMTRHASAEPPARIPFLCQRVSDK